MIPQLTKWFFYQSGGSHSGGTGNDFYLPLSPIDVDPGVMEPNLSRCMKLALLDVTQTIDMK